MYRIWSGIVVVGASATGSTSASADPAWTAAIHVGVDHTSQKIFTSFFDKTPSGTGPSFDLEGGLFVTPQIALMLSTRLDYFSDTLQYNEGSYPGSATVDEREVHFGLRLDTFPVHWLLLGAGVSYVWERENWSPGDAVFSNGVGAEVHAGVVIPVIQHTAFEIAGEIGRFDYEPTNFGDKLGNVTTFRMTVGMRWR